jgi:hypothetical protein
MTGKPHKKLKKGSNLMSNAASSIIRPNQRGARNAINNPYGQGYAAGGTPPHGPPWSLFNSLMGLATAAIIGLIGVVYFNLKDEIKDIKSDSKETRALQTQSARDISDLRISSTKMGAQLDQIIQRLPSNNPQSRP